MSLENEYINKSNDKYISQNSDNTEETNNYSQVELQKILNYQRSVIDEVSILNEKVEYIEKSSKEELNKFKSQNKKYSKHLKLIQNEFFEIHDLIKKINIELDKTKDSN